MFNRKNTKTKIRNYLRKDVIKIDRKTIFINPFLYWRRCDENTNSWLREPGQISAKKICSNRKRFFPELDWNETFNKYDYAKAYKRQLEMYQWLFRKNGFKVSDEAYLVYFNGKKNERFFNNKLHFDTHLIKLNCSASWVEGKVIETVRLLKSNYFPKPSTNCEYCNYLKQRWQLQNN